MNLTVVAIDVLATAAEGATIRDMDWTLVISIVLGVVTGVVANLLTKLFDAVLMPAYLNSVYRGVRIDGAWTVQQAEKASDEIGFSVDWSLSLTLKQSAQEVYGTATASCRAKGDTPEVINYRVEGTISDRFVQISLRPEDAQKLAFSSFLVEVTGDGGKMTGHRVFYGLKRREIRSVSVTLRRS